MSTRGQTNLGIGDSEQIQEWLSGVTYQPNEEVSKDFTVYICLVCHVSGDFATDRAANYWQVVGGVGGIETDPIFSASPAAGITSGDISNWNLAYDFRNQFSATALNPTIAEDGQYLQWDNTAGEYILSSAGAGFSYIKTNGGADKNPVVRRNINFVDSATISPSATDNAGTDSVDVSFDSILDWENVLAQDVNSGFYDPILTVAAGNPRTIRSSSAVNISAYLTYYSVLDTANVLDGVQLGVGDPNSKANPFAFLYMDGDYAFMGWSSLQSITFDNTGTYVSAYTGFVQLDTSTETIKITDAGAALGWTHTLNFVGHSTDNQYTFQNASGTLAFLTDIPAGAGDNIYNTDGTLTASRTVTMNALSLTLDGSGGDFIFSGSSGNASVSNLFTAQVYNASIGSGNGYRFNGFIDHKIYMTGAGNMFFEVDGNDLVRLQNAGGFRGVSINTGGAIPTATLDVQGVDDLAASKIFNVRNFSGGEIIRTFADGEIQIGQGGTSLGIVGIRTDPNVGELATLKVNQSGLSSARTAITAISDTGATAIRAIAVNGTAMYMRKAGTADIDSTLIVNRITGTNTTRQGSIELRSNTPADNTQDRQMAEIAWRGTAGDISGNENGLLLLKHAVAGTMTTGLSLSGSSLKANSGYDFETLDSTKGVVVLDRTNGNRYRIYTDGGVLNTELVP